MFDIGWTEMLVIAVVMIVVVGPKDLPRMLRTFGQMTKKLRGMAGDFQKQFNEALKEAELDDVKESVDALRSLNPAAQIKKQLNPFEKAAADVRSGLDTAMKPKPADAADLAPSRSRRARRLFPARPRLRLRRQRRRHFRRWMIPRSLSPRSRRQRRLRPRPTKPAAAAAGQAGEEGCRAGKGFACKDPGKPAKAATPKKKPAGTAK